MSAPEPLATRAGIASVAALILAQVAALSVWFSAAAVLPALARVHGVEASDLAILATATQAGFVVGALALAATGAADRFDPRLVFAACAVGAGLANMALLGLAPQSAAAVASRFAVGALLAGVYPVGLKIAVGWSRARRGLLASLLVGALTLGSALPQLTAFLGGADARVVLTATSALALVGAGLIAMTRLGPHHGTAARFSPRALGLVVTDRGVRRAYLGYFGHMWELYAFWAWAPAALVAAGWGGERAAAGVAFAAMSLGALACAPFGLLADRIGKARVAQGLLMASAAAGVAAAATASGPGLAFVLAILVWGACVIPDSPLFSAMVADAAPPEAAGSLLTLQTALGFALTIVSVQAAPLVAGAVGWGGAFALLAVGPVLGAAALRR